MAAKQEQRSALNSPGDYNQARTRKMNKTLWIVLAVAVIAASVIVSAPIGIERYAEGWLRDQGIAEPAIENVDLNPFTGVLRIESLSFSDPAGQRGEIESAVVNVEWTDLLARRILLLDVSIMGGEIDITKLADGRFAVGGLLFPLTTTQEQETVAEPEDEGAVWGLGLRNATVEDVEIRYRDELLNSQLAIRRIAVDSLATWEAERTSELAADFQLDGADIMITAAASPFARESSFDSKVTADAIRFDAYSAVLDTIDMNDAQGSLSLDLSTTVHTGVDGTLNIENAGTIEANEVTVTLPMANVENNRFAWTGNVSATVSADPNTETVYSGTNGIVVAGLTIRHRDKPITLVSVKELTIDDAVISSADQIDVGKVTIDSFQLLRSDVADAATIDIGNSRLDSIEFANQAAVTIERAVFDTAVVNVEREQSGQIKLVSEVISDLTQTSVESTEESAEEGGEIGTADTTELRFLIGQLEIGGDSRIHFRDTAVTPPHSSQVMLKNLSLSEFGNVDSKQSARLVFEVEQDDSTTLIGEGDFRWFDEPRTGDLTMSLKLFDLTQLSPYAPRYHIQRGRLSLDSRTKLAGDVLDVQNSVLLEKLKLSDKSAGEKSLLSEGMAMPLDVALDLLRDGDDRIELELPITGSIKDPKFGTGDILRAATQGAVQQAALSYVTKTLQPLGSIIFFAKIAGQAARPRFEPIQFEAGDAQLAEQARAYLDKIATMLSERPSLSITACGVSTAEDLDYLRAQLPAVPDAATEEIAELPTFEAERLELAQARGAAVRDYLTIERAVDAERLFRCRPTIEGEGDEGPRVEITL